LSLENSVTELAKGAGLFLGVFYVVSLTWEKLEDKPGIRNIVSGVLFGVAAVVAISTPVELGPGMLFDARMLFIGIGSAFGGVTVAIISSAIAIACRLWLGGAGAMGGSVIILSSAVIGLGFFWLRRRKRVAPNFLNFLLFGLLLHVAALPWYFIVPSPEYAEITGSTGIAMLITFTPVTALLCLLMTEIITRAEQHRENERRDTDFRNILDTMTDTFYRVDREGRITIVSPSVTEFLGYTQEEMLGRHIADFYFDPDERTRLLAALDAAGGRIRDYEAQQKTKDGRAEWVSVSAQYRRDADGALDGVEGVVRYISSRKQSEENLHVLAERLSLAARAGGMGIWDNDLTTGRQVWDERMCQLYGLPGEGLDDAEAYWRSAVHPDDLVRTRRAIADALEGKRLFHASYRILWPDQSIHHMESHALVHRNAAGTPLRVVGVDRDVTEEVEAEQRILKSQKMEAVGQLTGGVAHDFNNLLAIILGNLEFMNDYIEAGTELDTLKEGALKATLRGAELTQRLLAFSRRQTLNPSRNDANVLVTEMTELMRRTLGENIEIECNLAKKLDWVVIDPGQLENALLNLAINARDAMPDGGTLRISTENAILGRETGDDISTPGPYVMVSISDTGTGMPDGVRERIFEPFFTTKEIGKGSGLGLSMVYGFVRQSGGHVIVDSEAGKGTTIRLYLPRAKEVRRKPRLVAPVAADSPSGNEFVLVVEDDPDVRAFVVASLEKLGYRVSSAADGPEAVAKLEKLPPLDLLITDVVMPKGMNGKAVAEIVREYHPNARVLYTSGYARSEIVESGDRVTFLPKPYKRAVLAQTVRRLLDVA